MHIHYDGTIFSYWPWGGVSRYFQALIEALPAAQSEPVSYSMTADFGIGEIRPRNPLLQLSNASTVHFRPGRLSRRISQSNWRRASKKFAPDLWHFSYYWSSTGWTPCDINQPVVVTVWDMIHEKFPQMDSTTGFVQEAKRKCMNQADALLCISEHTRQDLLEIYPDLEAKARVIPLASHFSRVKPSVGKDALNLPHPYFLYVGQRQAYKNFSVVLEAFRQLHAQHPTISLCAVGPIFTEAEQRQISKYGLESSITQFHNVTDSQLATLYGDCLAFVYPSLYEGFGLPPLEAMTCGAPVIASNRTSIPEVVGDAALLFDPEDQSALLAHMQHVVETPELRVALVQKGYARAALFSWQRTAEQTLAVYRELAKF